MTRTLKNLLATLLALTICSCELHDKVDVSVKRKAVAYLRYHYDNGSGQTLDDIRSMRLFIYDRDGHLYRDTLLTRAAAIVDLGVLQTYISNGEYTFVSWANISETTITVGDYAKSRLHLPPQGADCLMYGRIDAPILKGDSLIFDIALFKSVFRVNVTIEGLQEVDPAGEYYFGMLNRSGIGFDNLPSGISTRYRPVLKRTDNGLLQGKFYTPWFAPGDDLTLGIYNDNPSAELNPLFETSIRDFTRFTTDVVGKDVQIDILIRITMAGIDITIRDWNGQIIQETTVGK